ncbi:MAG: ribosomal-processing cysteine protease Prp [Bacilli bacterium]|nr:ribosomal-processing cysteine protease Prp [Bacilli bacterium]
MIKVNIKNKNGKVYEIVVKGHAGYDDYGKDIVCAAVSTMMITAVNNIISLDDSIDYVEDDGLLRVTIKKETEMNQKILNNVIMMLEDLKSQYPKNIEIRNEV